MMNWKYELRRGHSHDPAEGACAMDAVNWLVHGKHGDAPECACPIISAYVINGNDRMPNDVRQRLIPYLHRIAGSRSKEHEAARLRVMVLAAVRVFAAKALDEAHMHDHAVKLHALPDDVGWAQMRGAAEAAEAAAQAAQAAAAAWMAAKAAAAAAERAAAAAAERAAAAAAAAAAWDEYFSVLDAALSAGPQGEPWSADVIEAGEALYLAAAGKMGAMCDDR